MPIPTAINVTYSLGATSSPRWRTQEAITPSPRFTRAADARGYSPRMNTRIATLNANADARGNPPRMNTRSAVSGVVADACGNSPQMITRTAVSGVVADACGNSPQMNTCGLIGPRVPAVYPPCTDNPRQPTWPMRKARLAKSHRDFGHYRPRRRFDVASGPHRPGPRAPLRLRAIENNPPLEYAPLFRSSINEDPRPRHRTNLGIGIRPPGGEGLLPHNCTQRTCCPLNRIRDISHPSTSLLAPLGLWWETLSAARAWGSGRFRTGRKCRNR